MATRADWRDMFGSPWLFVLTDSSVHSCGSGWKVQNTEDENIWSIMRMPFFARFSGSRIQRAVNFFGISTLFDLELVVYLKWHLIFMLQAGQTCNSPTRGKLFARLRNHNLAGISQEVWATPNCLDLKLLAHHKNAVTTHNLTFYTNWAIGDLNFVKEKGRFISPNLGSLFWLCSGWDTHLECQSSWNSVLHESLFCLCSGLWYTPLFFFT